VSPPLVLEITVLNPDVYGILRGVKATLIERRGFTCGIPGKSTMYKDEVVLGNFYTDNFLTSYNSPFTLFYKIIYRSII
jgi:hypothetical protein